MKVVSTGNWSASQDEELWNHDEVSTREDAIQFGKEEWLGESFLIGEIYSVDFTEEDCESLDLAERVVEQLSYLLSDEVGEAEEHWSNTITLEDEAKLNKMLAKTIMDWIQSNIGQPNVFKVDNIEVILED